MILDFFSHFKIFISCSISSDQSNLDLSEKSHNFESMVSVRRLLQSLEFKFGQEVESTHLDRAGS